MRTDSSNAQDEVADKSASTGELHSSTLYTSDGSTIRAMLGRGSVEAAYSAI